MAKKKKYYVVWVGNNPGIYESWAECQANIKGFPNARYKAFRSKEEAENAFRNRADDYYSSAKPGRVKSTQGTLPPEVKWPSICVDAACSGNPGVMEYRGVLTHSKEEIFRQGPFRDGTNNVGEFLAIVHGLAYLRKKNDSETSIYTDSRTALSWIRKKKANTRLGRTAKNRKLFELIRRAELWLGQNQYPNQILKWQTAKWGEIPADFGRK